MSRRSFDDPNSDEARQALLDNRTERKHPKRHRTRKRSIKIRQMKRERGVAKAKKNRRAQLIYLRKVRDFWNGDRVDHP